MVWEDLRSFSLNIGRKKKREKPAREHPIFVNK
jgi:hypothetical protein